MARPHRAPGGASAHRPVPSLAAVSQRCPGVIGAAGLAVMLYSLRHERPAVRRRPAGTGATVNRSAPPSEHAAARQRQGGAMARPLRLLAGSYGVLAQLTPARVTEAETGQSQRPPRPCESQEGGGGEFWRVAKGTGVYEVGKIRGDGMGACLVP